MRRIFFERNVESLSLTVLADPADAKVLVLPSDASIDLNLDLSQQALEKVGLLEKVVLNRTVWEELDSVIAIPWQSRKQNK